MSIGIIGAGKVGAVLGRAWRDAGHHIVGVSAVSRESRDRAEDLLPGASILPVDHVIAASDVVLLAVPDDVLGQLVSGLAVAGHWRPGHIVAHPAGRFGTGILRPAQDLGAIPIAFHPAMTFSGTISDLSRLAGAVCAVTASDAALPIGQALVVEWGAEPLVVAESDRGLYHAAVAHAANHLVVVMAQATQVLASLGVDIPGRLLEPLVLAALDRSLRHVTSDSDLSSGAIRALTGPVARGDIGTVAEHVRQLEDWAMRTGATDVSESYRALSRGATQRALAIGQISPMSAGQILDVLDGSES